MDQIRDLVYREDVVGLAETLIDSEGLEREYILKGICDILPFCAELNLGDLVRGSFFPYLLYSCQKACNLDVLSKVRYLKKKLWRGGEFHFGPELSLRYYIVYETLSPEGDKAVGERVELVTPIGRILSQAPLGKDIRFRYNSRCFKHLNEHLPGYKDWPESFKFCKEG